MIKTRFAPSPTGYLHLGNARTALLNFLFAKQEGGAFILRIDDTDDTRSKPEYEAGIKEDLSWLDIGWDETFSQSSRFNQYEAALEGLKSKGLLYPCYESEEELALARRTALQARRPPVYSRAALNLTKAERDAFEAQGIKPHWRFKLSQEETSFTDSLHGETSIKTDSLSDPVLIRADGRFLYTLPSVLDDLEHHITHIIRGDDHLTNSAVQVELAHALGGAAPIFAHHPLMVNEDGSPMSKRNEDLSLRYFREEGFEPEALVEFLAGRPFDFQKQASQNIRYQRMRLEKINSLIIHAMDWQRAKQRLPQDISQNDWEGLRHNLIFVKDAKLWHEVIYGQPNLPEQKSEGDFLQKALELLPPAPLNENSWGEWTKSLSAATGRKGRELYLPHRLALTGQEKGPEMKNLVLLLGREKISSRLRIA
jgi:glutamyl-tRNA synthetase